MKKIEAIEHINEIERLESAMLNHHILIHSIKQINEISQKEIDFIKIENELVMECIVDFVKENYVTSLGFQGLLERDGFKYITCSVKPDSCYKQLSNKTSLSEFLTKSKLNGVDFFDFSFPVDFLD